MTPRTARNLLLLCIAIAVLGAVTGCGIVQLRPADHYEWKLTREPMEWYRWENVGPDFAAYCGFHAFSRGGRGGEAGCITTIRESILQPGDRNIATGVARTDHGLGKLCIVFSSVDEDTANAITDMSRQRSLAAHEVGGHCNGYDHWPQF